MHPVLARKGILPFYLIAWVPLAGFLVFLLAMSGSLHWTESVALVGPLVSFYAFLLVSVSYISQHEPLHPASLIRLLATYLAASLICSILWVGVAKILGALLAKLPRFEGLGQRLNKALPLLLVTGVLLYLLSVAVHYVLLALETTRKLEANAMQARILARDSELKALKAQLNPHFLFNSLNSISALTAVDPGKARQMCVLLSDFLRNTLGLGEKTNIRLFEELSLARSFLAIEQVRFGSRLRLEEDIDSNCNSCLVPPLLLQPLIENAIVHGIANLVDEGWIRLSARRSGDFLSIIVENALDPGVARHRREGVGFSNVRKTLSARYGNNATFAARVNGTRYRVDLIVPFET